MFSLDVEIPEATRFLDDFRFKQVPFATSLALNRTGELAKGEQTQGIFDRFEIRNGAFVRKSVVQRRSTKRRLVTTLTVRDAFLTDHEEGGIRRPGDVTSGIIQAVDPKRRRVRKIRGRNTPRHVLKQKSFFEGKTRSGKRAVYQRLRGKGAGVKLIFVAEPKVNIKPRLKFGKTVTRVIHARWEAEFGRALERALATAR